MSYSDIMQKNHECTPDDPNDPTYEDLEIYVGANERYILTARSLVTVVKDDNEHRRTL